MCKGPKNYAVAYKIKREHKNEDVVKDILKRKDMFSMNESFWSFVDYFHTKAEMIAFANLMAQYCHEVNAMKIYHKYSITL